MGNGLRSGERWGLARSSCAALLAMVFKVVLLCPKTGWRGFQEGYRNLNVNIDSR